MEKIVELIKNNKLIEAYLLASKMGLSQEQKYDLFLSDEAKAYNKAKTMGTCKFNQSKRQMNKIIASVREDIHS